MFYGNTRAMNPRIHYYMFRDKYVLGYQERSNANYFADNYCFWSSFQWKYTAKNTLIVYYMQYTVVSNRKN